MKKIFSFFLVTLLALPIYAQQDDWDEPQISTPQKQEKFFTTINIGYEYNSTNEHTMATDITFKHNAKDYFSYDLGFRFASHDLYQARADLDFAWLVDEKLTKKVGFINSYRYSAYATNYFNDLTLALGFVYDQDYFYGAVGGYARMFSNIKSTDIPTITSFWEPGFWYDFKINVRPNDCVWNLGVEITNIRNFYVERMYVLNFMLNGSYRFSGAGKENFKLIYQVGAQPAGMFNLVANYYSFFANIGVVCAF